MVVVVGATVPFPPGVAILVGVEPQVVKVEGAAGVAAAVAVVAAVVITLMVVFAIEPMWEGLHHPPYRRQSQLPVSPASSHPSPRTCTSSHHPPRTYTSPADEAVTAGGCYPRTIFSLAYPPCLLEILSCVTRTQPASVGVEHIRCSCPCSRRRSCSSPPVTPSPRPPPPDRPLHLYLLCHIRSYLSCRGGRRRRERTAENVGRERTEGSVGRRGLPGMYPSSSSGTDYRLREC